MSYYRRGRGDESRVFVGNLPPDIRIRELEDLFDRYGRINRIDLKNKRGPPFAFIEYEDYRDAEDAVYKRDNYDYDGYKLRVEFTKSGSDYDRARSLREPRGVRGGQAPRRSQYRVRITGLPASGSWQDLKDHMREAGDVCYADTFKDGTGVVEFLRYDDMKYAIRKLDDTKFRSHEGESGYIRVREDASYSYGGSHGSGWRNSRSRSRSRSRSSSEDYRRERSYTPLSRSRSRSPSRSASASDDRD